MWARGVPGRRPRKASRRAAARGSGWAPPRPAAGFGGGGGRHRQRERAEGREVHRPPGPAAGFGPATGPGPGRGGNSPRAADPPALVIIRSVRLLPVTEEVANAQSVDYTISKEKRPFCLLKPYQVRRGRLFFPPLFFKIKT